MLNLFLLVVMLFMVANLATMKVEKFMLVLAVAMFLVTTVLLLNIAAVGQAPLAMYLFVGGIGYCVSITLIIATSFVE